MRRGALRRLISLSAALVLSSCTGGPDSAPAPGPVDFFREDVTLAVSRGRLLVRGVYDFRNETGDTVEMAIRYPFPVDDAHTFPDSVLVSETRGDSARPVSASPSAASVMWPMRFGPHETRRVTVEYGQDLHDNRAVYIVTTTAAWLRPIDRADFHIRIPEALEDVRISFAPDRVVDLGDTIVYHLRREAFLPESDLEITWR